VVWKSFHIRRMYRTRGQQLCARGSAQMGAMIGIHRGEYGQIIARTLQNGAGPAVKMPGPMRTL